MISIAITHTLKSPQQVRTIVHLEYIFFSALGFFAVGHFAIKKYVYEPN